jgi:hypothetical protein
LSMAQCYKTFLSIYFSPFYKFTNDRTSKKEK